MSTATQTAPKAPQAKAPQTAPKAPQTAPGKAPTYPATHLVTVLAAANPKAPGSKSHARWALYKTGMSVAAYFAAVKAAGQLQRAARADLAWDVAHGTIAIGATVAKPKA